MQFYLKLFSLIAKTDFWVLQNMSLKMSQFTKKHQWQIPSLSQNCYSSARSLFSYSTKNTFLHTCLHCLYCLVALMFSNCLFFLGLHLSFGPCCFFLHFPCQHQESGMTLLCHVSRQTLWSLCPLDGCSSCWISLKIDCCASRMLLILLSTHLWGIFVADESQLLNLCEPQERQMTVYIYYMCVFFNKSVEQGHSWPGSAGGLQSHETPLCPICSHCYPHILHRDNSTVWDCEQNKRPQPFSSGLTVALWIFWRNRIWAESRWKLSSPGITPAWVFGLAWDRTLERFWA